MTARFVYFKLTGKYYSESTLEIVDDLPMYKIHELAKELVLRKKLPGLCEDPSNFFVIVDCSSHPNNVPRLIFPKNYYVDQG